MPARPDAYPDEPDAPLLTVEHPPDALLIPNQNHRSLRHSQSRVLAVAAALCVSFLFGGYLSAAPQLKILEDMVCEAYYAPSGFPPAKDRHHACKEAPIQAQVAQINGWKGTFDVLPSVLLSVVYGALAGRVGRKPMVLLALLGVVLGDLWVRLLFSLPVGYLPLRWIWASSLFRLVGGGEQVVISLFMIAVTDVFPEKERTGALFRLMAVRICSEVVASPLSALLMAEDPWLPFSLGIVLEIIGVAIGLFLPETLSAVETERSKLSGHVGDDGGGDGDGGLAAIMKRELGKMRGPVEFVKKDMSMALLLFAATAVALGQNTTDFVIQYAALKLSWTYAQAVALFSISGVVALVNTLVFLPLLTSYLDNGLRLRPNVRDYSITQLSALLLIAGTGLLSIATSVLALIVAVLLTSLGSAYPIALRSLAADLIDAEEVALFYSGVTTMESVGMLISGPLFAALFELGLGLGGAWLGFPFLAAAAFVLLAFVAVSRVRLSHAVVVEPPSPRTD